MKNIDTSDFNQKIKTLLLESRNQTARKVLDLRQLSTSPPNQSTVQSPKTLTADDPDPIQKGFKKGFSGIARTVKSDLYYKMMATKDHYELTTK